MYLRFNLLRGFLDADEYEQEIRCLKGYLSTQQAAHWQEFLSAWGRSV